MPIMPASLSFDEAGTPYSAQYGDRYHSASSGPGQARHVFLDGNDIPARWVGQPSFTILETGFGLGTNFLATWQAWREHSQRPARLHVVSIEKHPLDVASLAEVHSDWPEWRDQSLQLRAQWPPLVGGVYRLVFENGGVVLTLAFMDIAEAADALRLRPDAYYFDGFAPERNPDMWSDRVIRRLARLAQASATAATWSSAPATRASLTQAGFEVTRTPGFAPKRHMTRARYAPPWPVSPPAAVRVPEGEREAIVVGSGLAGTAVAAHLGRRGWRVALIDEAPGPGGGASALASVFHVHVSPDDALLSRLTRACGHYLTGDWISRAGTIEMCGVALLADDNHELGRMRKAVESLSLPADYALQLNADDLSMKAGAQVSRGGLWLPTGGWAAPALMMDEAIKAAGDALTMRYRHHVDRLERRGGRWHAWGRDGKLIASAPVIVLANAHDAVRLAPIDQPLAQTRGQITAAPASMMAHLKAVVAGNGYVTPPRHGYSVIGATHDDDMDAALSLDAHRSIVSKARGMLPSLASELERLPMSGSVAFRCVTPDHLPVIGAMPDLAACRGLGSTLPGMALPRLPRLPGLYGAFGLGSRGLLWAGMGAELIACLISAEPLPLERALCDAVDPGRFVLRNSRRTATVG